ncbi:C39 family peptidase [Desulfonatronovibrio hydrogenovorans]|uniref:C39 family peptidase n=1 Tax=Desulfonatronovibrio hydrogenovorans TaxID=53245 RepID=UPI000691365F
MSFNSFRYLFCPAIIVLWIWGCTPFKEFPDQAGYAEGTVRLEVPYVPQVQDNDCGPAALASVLGFWGVDVSLEELTREVYIPALRRTLMPDMENYARMRGLAASSGRGDVFLLKQSIDSGAPIIALLETGSGPVRRPHYVVITGYTKTGFITHAGVMENAFILFDDFDRRWKEMNRLYLIITRNQTP